MGALDGTLQTPFGAVSKKTALIVGGGAVLIIGVGYYRSKQAQKTAATASAGASVGTDPATGFLYGSPEDAAALANQATYVTPTGAGGGNGGAATTTTGYVSNGQWAQAAVQYMTAQGLVTDPSQLSSALGKYITGSPVNAAEQSLIQQAIAFQGLPPVAGPAGYPPSLNTSTTTTPPPTGGGGTDSRKGPPYPFDGSPTAPTATVLPGWVVDTWVGDLQRHGVHVIYQQIADLNGGIANNIHNPHGPSGPHSANTFVHGATYHLPSQSAWYK